jgi:hypothetical protein
MRRLVPFATLFTAACATAPQQQPAPQPTVIAPISESRGTIIGLTAGELVQRFGNPSLQIREGSSLKLQFRRRNCVLDAYLYSPPSGGVQRVSHVDTRNVMGTDMTEQSCIATLQIP